MTPTEEGLIPKHRGVIEEVEAEVEVEALEVDLEDSMSKATHSTNVKITETHQIPLFSQLLPYLHHPILVVVAASVVA